MRKKLIALLALTAMIITILPSTAFAAVETVEVPSGMTFTSSTTQEEVNSWATGAANITKNADGTYTVTLQKNIILGTSIIFGDYRDKAGADQPTIILDLNGFTLTGKSIVVCNYGNLIIKDSKGTGKVVYDGGEYMVAVQNAGYSLTVEGGTFECNGAGSAGYNAAINTTSTSKTVINGGVFDGKGAGALIVYGTVIVNSGTFNGTYGVVSKKANDNNTGNVIFPETSTAVVNAKSMAFVVQGDKVAAGSISANGGTFNAPKVVGSIGNEVVPANQVKIAGGNYTSDPSAFVADNTALIGLTNKGTTQYAAGGDAQIMANSAKDGDTITVFKGDKIDAPDKVKVDNQTGKEINVNGEPVGAGDTIEAHSYGKDWQYDENNHWHKCSNCEEKTDIAAHDWNEWKVTQKATETQKGSKERSCNVCGYKAIEEIPMLTHTHSYVAEWKTDGTNHWHACSCGAKADEAVHTFAWITDKKATADEKGSKHEECTVCGYKKAAVEIPATGTVKPIEPSKPSNPNDSDKNNSDTEATSPKTGDSSNFALWITLLFACCGALTTEALYSRKRRKTIL